MRKLNPFKPTDIGGCVLWLDGADSSKITLGSGSNVSTWIDKSSLANNFTNTNTTSPTKTTTPGGYPCVYLNGSTCQMTSVSNNSTTGNSSRTVIMISQTGAGGDSRFGTGPHGGASPPNTYGIDLAPIANIIFCPYVYTGSDVTAYGVPNTNMYSLYSYYNSSTSTVGGIVNFTLTASNSTTLNTSATPWYLGLRPDGGYSTAAYVCEIIQYNIILTTAQRQQLEGYLAQKWGMQANLPAGSPGRTGVIYPRTLLIDSLTTGQPTRKPYIIPKKILVLVGGVSVFSYLPLATNSTDVGGTPQTVTINGTVTYTTIASKQCAYFSNSLSNYLSVTYVPQTQITLCFWLYVIDSGEYTAISINDGALNPTLQFSPVGGNFFYAHTAMPNQWTNVPQGSYPGPGQWVHFAITVNYATYFEQVYVNGTSVSTATGTGPPTIPQTNIWLGRSGDAARAYYGYIRQFCTFPSILTQAQIQSIITFTT